MTKPSRKGATLPQRPHQWRSGPDPALRPVFRAFVQCRNQAQWRGEDWELSWEQWRDIWHGWWHLRGRGSDSVCITRKNCDLPWQASNVILITRHQHGTRKRGISTALNQTANDVLLTDLDDVRNRTVQA